MLINALDATIAKLKIQYPDSYHIFQRHHLQGAILVESTRYRCLRHIVLAAFILIYYVVLILQGNGRKICVKSLHSRS